MIPIALGLVISGRVSSLVMPQQPGMRRHTLNAKKDDVLVVPADWPTAVSEACDIQDDLSVRDAAALVGGTTVGAGILALPSSLAKAGFVAGTVTLLLSYVFMVTTALLIAETTTTAICELKRPGLGILKTSTVALGDKVGAVSGGAYCFIHYALLVAYNSQGGAVISSVLDTPRWVGVLMFASIFGGLVALAPAKTVDLVNSALVVVVIASFGGIVTLAAPQIDVQRLLAMPTDWSAAFAAVPICVLALVFHNVVPVIVTRFSGDRQRVTQSILLGSAGPLVLFLIWSFVVLASVDDVTDAVTALETNGADIAVAVNAFSLAAVATSFFGFFYGLQSFLQDVIIDLPNNNDLIRQNANVVVPLAILVPPVVLALALGSDVFLTALDAAGTFGITLLFGIVPAATAWQQRSRSTVVVPPYLPGGAITLAVVIALAATVFAEGAVDLVLKPALAASSSLDTSTVVQVSPG